MTEPRSLTLEEIEKYLSFKKDKDNNLERLVALKDSKVLKIPYFEESATGEIVEFHEKLN